jgi:hypothetical protein
MVRSMMVVAGLTGTSNYSVAWDAIEHTIHKEDAMRYCLVYQAGIANVFLVDTFNLAKNAGGRKRILQSDFKNCESFSRGLAHADMSVASCYCNQAGDITNAKWRFNLEDAPFYEYMNPVYNNVVSDSWIEFSPMI